MNPVSAVVMASGFSRRMGRNKLLLPWENGTVIGSVLDRIGRIGYDTVAVVSQYTEILEMAGIRGFVSVGNPYAAEGKSSSIRLGIAALEERATSAGKPMPLGIIFFPGDQVLMTDQLLWKLNECFLQAPDRIVVPVYDGRPGSPVTFPADRIPLLKTLKGEEGGMKAVGEERDRILYIPAEAGWQGMDVDSEEDWERVKQYHAALPPHSIGHKQDGKV
ncbi:MAG: NTP transferase domain-containing protein [Clostridiales bacterium]|nr:NTP transferase domain-containing protein [Clostridiales bacterium]